ncbi:ATP-binding protein [Nocardioides daejeonensis]|uniref:ATP-binding protein n=1 Tax=Nocardioides daejeonensis TaxID=1046556 RepID=UPI000D748926|nr:ATP-binding protein [Nocardioides daejeonensis]
MTLEASPQSAKDARRWAAEACLHLGRPDLVASAELAISELVTNALLHAVPPIRLSVHGTPAHPRFEVSDGSAAPPIPHPRGGADDDLLSTIGRGLTLVAMSSTAWGAYIRSDGKTVWFEPSAGLIEHPTFLGEVYEVEPSTPRAAEREAAFEVWLLNFPTRQYAAWVRHFRDLQRELRLLALAHETTYPMARQLSDLLSTFSEQVGHAEGFSALAVEVGARDRMVRLPADAAPVLEQMAGVLDLADAFCRSERMLTPAATPEGIDFQRWFFSEMVAQAHGAEPIPWEPGRPAAQPRS